MTVYTRLALEQRDEAVERVRSGETRESVCKDMKISFSTLKRLLRLAKDGKTLELKAPGPPPTLSPECESDLVTWIFAMQRCSFPVMRADVLQRMREICMTLAIPEMSDSWYFGFRQRHPEITDREAQVVSRTRTAVDRDALYTLFSTLAKLVIELKIDPTRIYNMDETAFASRSKTTKVLAARGSTNIHAKSITTNFHMSIVASASASGDVMPPLFILPGQRVDESTAAACSVQDARITTSTSGFINADIFLAWLAMFSESVPATVVRPVILVCDGYLSHFSHDNIMATLEQLGVLLVCLPANATHLVQPLDVAVFAPFKKFLRKSIKTFMIEASECSVSKHAAVHLASVAWSAAMTGTNAKAGFKACGIYPPSFAAMEKRLARFGKGGTKADDRDYSWLKHKEKIRSEILTLPPLVDSAERKRKTVNVAGRLLTRDMIASELCSKRKRN
ncbi:hypothetical protein ACHHYP_08712 [Achlya hypogyna]|uniref:HTH CENPB-type domain-containing protein n=1 Tax=Achlya hypogyna TaxID=1202772 RepID=A0A1V9YP74_ACHHY|nr:hypothetical protein ACHHYP_08712 [Achlya hypogyna]